MKIIIIALILSTQLHASPILRCLGQEEAQIHKLKQNNARAKLNKSLISIFLQLSDQVAVKPVLLDQICIRHKDNASLELLKLILFKKRDLFVHKNKNIKFEKSSLDYNAIGEVVQKSYAVFTDYINYLQAYASKPNCITRGLPEVDEYFYKSRYILEDVEIKKLFEDHIKVQSLFKKLKDPNYFQNC